MLTKNEILDSLLREIEIIRHLATKVPAGALDFRLSEGQRTTLELMRYLTFCGIGGALSMRDGNWDGYQEWAGKCAELSADEIPAALDRQADALKSYFDGISTADFDSKIAKSPLGEELPLGRALLEMPLKWMTGYRMQLFLQAKASGSSEIGTANCWAGIDRPAEPAS